MESLFRNIIILKIGIVLLAAGSSCKKFLDAPTDKKLVILNNLTDAQALLDDNYRINYRDISAGEESADNHFLPVNVWTSLNEFERARYIWSEERVIPPYGPNSGGNAWSQTYDIIYVANTVLDFLENRQDLMDEQWMEIKGQALFLRAKSFLQLAWVWSLAYDSITASTDLGIPLRLTPNFNTPSVRSNLQETYDQIVIDLNIAASLLQTRAVHVMRPSKAAAYGYLARTFLSMRKYSKAFSYADSCLKINSSLLDYNSIQQTTPFPTGIGKFNEEVIYSSRMGLSNSLYFGRIPENIYNLYDVHDLRKHIFFREEEASGVYIFMGSYEQDYDLFSGVSVDEMLLIRAECFARAGDVVKALEDLNNLLVKRWIPSYFVPISTSDKEEALGIILDERRKELIMRGLRWSDIKRLNKEERNIQITRYLESTHTLLPNDLRYALAIPEDVISLSGIEQNPR